MQAVAEMIWNGLDADATQVDVRLEFVDRERFKAFALRRVVVWRVM